MPPADLISHSLRGSDLPVLPILNAPGNIWYVDGSIATEGDGKSWAGAKLTIQAAIDAASVNDRIIVAPKGAGAGYNETLSVPITKAGLIIIGAGGRGAAFVEPTTAGAEGCQVLANDVTFVNIGIAGDDTGDYALNLQGSRPGGAGTKYGKRFRAYGCKFELADGANPAVLLNGTADYQASDAAFYDCEFAYAGYGVQFDDSSYGYPTQVRIQDCWFHNIATECIGEAAGGGVNNLWVVDCWFDRKEDGTAPSDFIKVNRAGDTGIITGCRFALATNASADLKIAAGVLWVSNATEAGWSTARPA